MAVVKLRYTRNKEEIKANIRYFTHRAGRNSEKKTRDIFTNVGETDKQEFYRQVRAARRGELDRFLVEIMEGEKRAEQEAFSDFLINRAHCPCSSNLPASW
jgi:hypothetical protein